MKGRGWGRGCELCSGEAALYCPSDSAFLCSNCDAKVHQANFLVARHVRRTLCPNCKVFTGNRFSGAGSCSLHRICRLCSDEPPSSGEDLDSLSSSSTCISYAESCSTPPSKKKKKKINFDRRKIVSSSSVTDQSSEATSKKKKKKKKSNEQSLRSMDSKTEEGILVNWIRKLGLVDICDVALPVAVKGFGVLSGLELKLRRVSLAASLWFSFGLCGVSTWQLLKRLDEISGVPAKLILAAGAKLARVSCKRRSLNHHQQQQEGWAECSV